MAAIVVIGALIVIGGVLLTPDDEDDDDQAQAPTSTLTEPAPEPTQTPQPTETPTASPTPEPSATPSPTEVPPTATATPEPEPTPTHAPTCEVGCVQVGVTLEEFPGPIRVIDEFGQLSGRQPDMVMFFQAWGDADAEFKEWLPDLAATGVAPLITWEPWRRDEFLNQQEFTLQSIIDGEHDDYINEWAEKSAAHGDTIFLRFAHEMNTPPGEVYWYPWQGDPETYIAAWRYIHDRFEAAGADNVEWVWSVAWMNADAELYYPGDEYVDWVAITILNFGETVAQPGWKSFAALYAEQHERTVSFGKPVMISELGSVEQGGDKAEWILGIADAIKNQYPEIQAIIWNNYSAARHVPDANWSVQSSPDVLEAWRTLLQDPIFQRVE